MTWLTQEAQIIAFEEPNLLTLEACTAQGCGTCSLAAGCGQGLLAGWLQKRRPYLQIKASAEQLSSQQLAVGDKVILGLEAKQLNGAAVLQFLVPLLFLLSGAVLGEFFGLTSSLSQALSGLLGLVLGLLVARKLAAPSQIHLLTSASIKKNP